jgi:hypothetical protein
LKTILHLKNPEKKDKNLKDRFDYQYEPAGMRRSIWNGVKLNGRYNIECEQQILA